MTDDRLDAWLRAGTDDLTAAVASRIDLDRTYAAVTARAAQHAEEPPLPRKRLARRWFLVPACAGLVILAAVALAITGFQPTVPLALIPPPDSASDAVPAPVVVEFRPGTVEFADREAADTAVGQVARRYAEQPHGLLVGHSGHDGLGRDRAAAVANLLEQAGVRPEDVVITMLPLDGPVVVLGLAAEP